MQPTPATEAANAEVAKDLASTSTEPEAARHEAQQQAQADAVEIDEPRKRGWRFWRRRV
jgi:hypothetical protein